MNNATDSRKVYAPLNAMRAALLFASKNDVLKYLEGICVEHGPSGSRLIATDGHRLLVVSLNTDDGGPIVRYIIPRATAEAACKAFAKSSFIELTWEQTSRPDPERDGVTIVECAKVSVGGLVCSDAQDRFGKFPEYERIVPRSASGVVAHYNAAYLLDCSKAKDLLCGKSKVPGFVIVAHNGDKPGLVHLGQDAFAVVMPMRAGDVPTLPKWFTGPALAKTEAA